MWSYSSKPSTLLVLRRQKKPLTDDKPVFSTANVVYFFRDAACRADIVWPTDRGLVNGAIVDLTAAAAAAVATGNRITRPLHLLAPNYSATALR